MKSTLWFVFATTIVLLVALTVLISAAPQPALAQAPAQTQTPLSASTATTIQFVYTSDAHYGLTRPTFQGAKEVDAQKVNAALVATINNLPNQTLPCNDGGVNACKPIGAIDFVAETGDIANVSTALSTTPMTYIQSAAASWAQFETDYIKGLTVKDKSGNRAPLYVTPGNHDAWNAIGFLNPMSPTTDATAMAQIYNLMLRPTTLKTKDTYNYATDKVFYSKDIGGVHMEFISMWPDSAARAWMADDLQKVSATTPVVIFAHIPPDAPSSLFTNPNGKNDINATDKFTNLLVDKFADSTKTTDAAGNPVPSLIEQRAFVAFLKEHKNIVAYFHGHANWNQFYTYTGPDDDIALPTFRVDSPMRGDISSKDESKLSYQVVSIDSRTLSMTVREYLWNTKTWGAATTVSQAPAVDPALVKEMAPTGTLRIAVWITNSNFIAKNATAGELSGVWIEMAKELSSRLGIPYAIVETPSSTAPFEAIKNGQADIGFADNAKFGLDDPYADVVDVTAPFLVLPITLLVPTNSPIKTLADLKQPGLRFAVPSGGTADTILTRDYPQVQLVRWTGATAAIYDLLKAGQVDGVGGAMSSELSFIGSSTDYRVLSEPLLNNTPVIALRKGHPAELEYLKAFVEDIKGSGLMQRLLDQFGKKQGVFVAPPAVP